MIINNFTYGGTALTDSFESCILTAYQDSKGVWTIGWGSTGPGIVEGLVWTQEQADSDRDVKLLLAQACVNISVDVAITQDENDGLVDLVYNIGRQAFRNSTMLRLLNAGNIEGAAGEFDKWDFSGGVQVAGLLRRRQAETQLFDKT